MYYLYVYICLQVGSLYVNIEIQSTEFAFYLAYEA